MLTMLFTLVCEDLCTFKSNGICALLDVTAEDGARNIAQKKAIIMFQSLGHTDSRTEPWEISTKFKVKLDMKILLQWTQVFFPILFVGKDPYREVSISKYNLMNISDCRKAQGPGKI